MRDLCKLYDNVIFIDFSLAIVKLLSTSVFGKKKERMHSQCRKEPKKWIEGPPFSKASVKNTSEWIIVNNDFYWILISHNALEQWCVWRDLCGSIIISQNDTLCRSPLYVNLVLVWAFLFFLQVNHCLLHRIGVTFPYLVFISISFRFVAFLYFF